MTRYGYTGQGDVSHIQYADGREVKYSYNPLRHLQEMEDWLGITKIATDPLGRAENVQYPDDKKVSYTYGKAGERTSITYPDGRTIYYGFDEQVRLSELRDGDSVITYGYDKTGRLAEKHFPKGMHTDYRYIGKLKVLSPNNLGNPNVGETLIKYGKTLRIDVEIKELLHFPLGTLLTGTLSGIGKSPTQII